MCAPPATPWRCWAPRPKASLEKWRAEDTLGGLCELEAVSDQRDQVYVYVLLHRSCESDVTQKLKEGGFAPVTLPPSPLSARERLSELAAEETQVDEKQRDVTARTAALAGELPVLRQLFDILQSRRARLAAARNFSVSERPFFLQGGCPHP
jgi:hypothetical protein